MSPPHHQDLGKLGVDLLKSGVFGGTNRGGVRFSDVSIDVVMATVLAGKPEDDPPDVATSLIYV
jgi:hypothetical protein